MSHLSPGVSGQLDAVWRRATPGTRNRVEGQAAAARQKIGPRTRSQPRTRRDRPKDQTPAAHQEAPSARLQRGTHRSCPALIVVLVIAFTDMISCTTTRGSTDGSAAEAIDHSVWPGCTTISRMPR